MHPELSVNAHHFEAMGTTCSLFVVGQSRGRLLEGESWVRHVGARLTRFALDSELSRLNARAGEWIEVSEEMEAVLRAALEAYAMSSGLVNAAVLPSVLAVGYTRPLVEGPTVATLDRVGPTPALPEVLEVGGRGARVRTGSSLDLGGIAKGWMADRLCERLGDNALVNLGGDLRARGLAIIVLSTEPETVLSLADRILVLRRGAVVREFSDEAISKDRLLEAA